MDKFGQRALAAWKQSRAGAAAMAGGRARVRVVWSGREWHGAPAAAADRRAAVACGEPGRGEAEGRREARRAMARRAAAHRSGSARRRRGLQKAAPAVASSPPTKLPSLPKPYATSTRAAGSQTGLRRPVEAAGSRRARWDPRGSGKVVRHAGAGALPFFFRWGPPGPRRCSRGGWAQRTHGPRRAALSQLGHAAFRGQPVVSSTPPPHCIVFRVLEPQARVARPIIDSI